MTLPREDLCDLPSVLPIESDLGTRITQSVDNNASLTLHIFAP